MKKFYISFGQTHVHSRGGRTYDRNCIAQIEAENHRKAHDLAMLIFDGVFHNVYDELPNMEYFPRGIIKVV